MSVVSVVSEFKMLLIVMVSFYPAAKAFVLMVVKVMILLDATLQAKDEFMLEGLVNADTEAEQTPLAKDN